ncbi:Zinc knuckle CX2CX4HX4C [Parasponia andersonii]|uniref:Zinc knuckle CX2CX4HX4C n=1 Tax=Parasponia andersonii TaxID=3476 RepID=A0A2P5BWD0_PARAD|nr:Zinc knuckle CX2CX4HX4C [Parasponia andersonii]
MENLWRPGPRFSIQEIERDMFIFSFEAKADWLFVLDRELWAFDKSLLVLMKMEDFRRHRDQNFCFLSMWVQLHNILLYNMTEAIVRFVSSKIGKWLEVDFDDNGRCWGCFTRSQIHFYKKNPLNCRIKVRLGSASECFWVEVKYECIPDFCFLCGRVRHVVRDCKVKIDEELKNSTNYNFGAWLKAYSGRRSGSSNGWNSNVSQQISMRVESLPSSDIVDGGVIGYVSGSKVKGVVNRELDSVMGKSVNVAISGAEKVHKLTRRLLAFILNVLGRGDNSSDTSKEIMGGKKSMIAVVRSKILRSHKG